MTNKNAKLLEQGVVGKRIVAVVIAGDEKDRDAPVLVLDDGSSLTFEWTGQHARTVFEPPSKPGDVYYGGEKKP